MLYEKYSIVTAEDVVRECDIADCSWGGFHLPNKPSVMSGICATRLDVLLHVLGRTLTWGCLPRANPCQIKRCAATRSISVGLNQASDDSATSAGRTGVEPTQEGTGA